MPPLDRPTLSKAELDRLNKIYAEGQKRLLATFDNATDFGQARRIELLAQINAILDDMGVQTADWLNTVIPAHYERGTGDLLAQFAAMKINAKDLATMSTIDRGAVAALISDAQASFGTALTTVGHTANRIMSDAVKEQITNELALGRVMGSTRNEVNRAIKRALKSEGLTALVDKGGRTWTLDRYADMLGRTKMVEARNTGLANKMVSNGYDLVEVSDHMSSHKECARYEGEILSLTGKTPGYTTLATANANGLLHPNCRHQINAVRTRYADITTAYDSRSKTYVQPFKSNPPLPQTATLKPAPAKAPALTSLTFGSGKKKATYDLNPIEAMIFADRTIESGPISYGTSKPRGKRWGSGEHGVYNETFNKFSGEVISRSMLVRYPGTDEAKHTFYHEIGHAIDANVPRLAKGITTPNIRNYRLVDNKDVKAALKKDTPYIIRQRIDHMYGRTLADDQLDDLAAGKIVRYTKIVNGTPTTYRAELDDWLDYAKGAKELFADGYGQWRLNPAEFKKHAPAMAKIYEGVINGTINQ